MSRVQVSLVGEQPMPTVISALQLKADVLHLIVSEYTAGVGENIAAALVPLSVRGADSPLAPYQMEDLRRHITDLVRNYRAAGHEVLINLTGGTKLMSLAAFRAAQDCAVPALYVAMERDALLWFLPDGGERIEPIHVVLPVVTYLEAHGLRIERTRPPSSYSVAARFIAENAPAGIDVLRAAATSIQGGFQDVGSLGIPARHFAGKLRDLGLLDVRQSPTMLRVRANPHAATFLAGGWLEEFLYHALRESGHFDDVALGVCILSQRAPEEEVRNELDVVATRNGRLIVCSCKTGRRTLENASNTQGMIYELDWISRREHVGIYCTKALVTNQVDLPEAFHARARSSGILVVDGRQLPQVAARILRHMEGPPA